MTVRLAVSTLAELDALDSTEIVEGYQDGFAGEPEPGDNRSLSYWHGWRNGASDRNCTADDAQRALALAIVQRSHNRVID